MRSFLVTALAAIAALLCVLVLLGTKGYTMRVPQGADAMGLVVPLVAAILAGLALVVATVIALGDGRLAWIAPAGAGVAGRAVAIAIGIACAVVGAMIVWASSRGWWVVPLGLAGGGVAPLLMAGVLATSRAAGTAPSRGVLAVLVPVAGIGYALAVAGLGVWFVADARNRVAQLEEYRAREARHAREATMTPAERLTEVFADFDADAPAWSIVSSFLQWGDDAGARAVIVERTFKVPDLDADLARTLVSEYPQYRTAALAFVQWVDDARLRPAWCAAVAQSIDSTTAAVRADATWLHTGDQVPPGPVGNVRAIRAAAARYPRDTAVARALAELTRTVTALPASARNRDSALAILAPRRD